MQIAMRPPHEPLPRPLRQPGEELTHLIAHQPVPGEDRIAGQSGAERGLDIARQHMAHRRHGVGEGG